MWVYSSWLLLSPAEEPDDGILVDIVQAAMCQLCIDAKGKSNTHLN